MALYLNLSADRLDLMRPYLFPAYLCQAALAARMKYVNITTRHHDSFCLFATKQTDFHAVNSPARRDLVREIARHRQLATVQGGVAEAGLAVLGLDLQGDEVAAGTGDDDPRAGDLHRGLALAGTMAPRAPTLFAAAARAAWAAATGPSPFSRRPR